MLKFQKWNARNLKGNLDLQLSTMIDANRAFQQRD